VFLLTGRMKEENDGGNHSPWRNSETNRKRSACGCHTDATSSTSLQGSTISNPLFDRIIFTLGGGARENARKKDGRLRPEYV